MDGAAADALKSSFDAKALQKLLTQTGPVCKCVFVPLTPSTSSNNSSSSSSNGGSSSSSSSSSSDSSTGKNGVPMEVSLDMTPKVCAPALQLGGTATICASYDDIDVIVMKLRTPADDMPVNPHTLPAPFQEFVVNGPMLFIRMDQNSEPKDFTLEEYKAYAEKIAKNPPPAMKDLEEQDKEDKAKGAEQEDGEDDDEEEEDYEESDSDGDDNDDYWQHVVDRVVTIFKESKGRDPTEEELKVLLEQLNQGREAMEEDGEDEEEAEEEEKEKEVVDVNAMIRTKLTEALTAQLGRAPTEEELNEMMEQLSQDESLHASLLAAQGGGSASTSSSSGSSSSTSDNKEAPSATGETVDVNVMIRTKLTEALTAQLGRAPTEEELNEMMEQLSQDESLHASLLAAQNATAVAPTPSPPASKKRPLEESTPAVQGTNKRPRKEVSPDSIASVIDSK